MNQSIVSHGTYGNHEIVLGKAQRYESVLTIKYLVSPVVFATGSNEIIKRVFSATVNDFSEDSYIKRTGGISDSFEHYWDNEHERCGYLFSYQPVTFTGVPDESKGATIGMVIPTVFGGIEMAWEEAAGFIEIFGGGLKDAATR